MKLTDYLEMLTVKEFRQKMADAGLQANTTTTIVQEEVPDWLKEDAGIWHDEFEDFKTKKDIINRLQDDGVKEANQVPIKLNGRIRLAVMPNGTVYWCTSNELIHSNLIAYAMCKNLVPMIQNEFGDGHWAWNVNGYKYILLLEHWSFWAFAETYDSDVVERIKAQLQNDARYDKVFAQIGINKNEIENANEAD